MNRREETRCTPQKPSQPTQKIPFHNLISSQIVSLSSSEKSEIPSEEETQTAPASQITHVHVYMHPQTNAQQVQPTRRHKLPPAWTQLPLAKLSQRAFAATTTQADRRAWNCFREVAREFPDSKVTHVLKCTIRRWEHLKATTRQRYVHALLKVMTYMAPSEWHVSPEEAYLIRRMSKRRSPEDLTTHRAWAITPEMMIKVLQHSKVEVSNKGIVLLAWLTASRMDDILRTSTSFRWDRTTLRMHIGLAKNDQEARGFTKFIPKWIARILVRFVPNFQRPSTAKKLIQQLKKVDNRLSGHSMRRGAATTLANKGYSHTQITRLTGHRSRHTEAEKGVMSYIEPQAQQPTGRLQQQMMNSLARTIGLVPQHPRTPPSSRNTNGQRLHRHHTTHQC